MKKLISILTTSILCAGMCSSPVYANAADERPTYIYNTPEELLEILVSKDEELTDGEAFYPDNYKIDAVDRGNRCDIIIYGLKNVKQISEIYTKWQENGCMFAGYPEIHSGVSVMFGSKNFGFESGKTPDIYFFVTDTLTDGCYNDMTLLDAAKEYGFDVAPYVCTNIIPGDTDFDGTITPADASTVLSAYAELSTGEKLVLNSTIFDYNNDSEVDPSDASAILAKYAEISTLNPVAKNGVLSPSDASAILSLT